MKRLITFLLAAHIFCAVSNAGPQAHHSVVARQRASVGYDSDAQAYFDAIVSAGSSISTDNKNAWNTCVVGLKADSVWTLITELYVFVGPDDLTGALLKAKGSGSLTNVNFVSGDYSRTTGLAGNGSSKYLETNVLASSLTGGSHTLYWSATGMETSGDFTAIGAFSGSEDSLLALDMYAAYVSARAFRSATFTAGQFPQSNTGLVADGSIAGVRRSTTDAELYQAGASIATNGSTKTPSFPTLEIYLFTLNNSGSTTSKSGCRARIGMIGTAMSDAELAAFDARIATYIAAVQ